jgi:hypothetical protein
MPQWWAVGKREAHKTYERRETTLNSAIFADFVCFAFYPSFYYHLRVLRITLRPFGARAPSVPMLLCFDLVQCYDKKTILE